MDLKVKPGIAIEKLLALRKKGYELEGGMNKELKEYESLDRELQGGTGPLKLKYSKLLVEWREECLKSLEEIYSDPFIGRRFDPDPNSYVSEKAFRGIQEEINKRQTKLSDFYNELQTITTPTVEYDRSTGMVRYKEKEIHFEQEERKGLICEFMFGYPVGKLVQLDNLMEHFDSNLDSLDEKARKRLKSSVIDALKDINKKTNKEFDFPILQRIEGKYITRLDPTL